MIKKLKLKFVVLSTVSLFILLTVIVSGMNLINYNSVVNEADEVLNLLCRNKGAFPDFRGDKGDRLPPDMSPELPYESRYFSVLLNTSGNVIYTETSKITAVDTSSAIEYAKNAISSNKQNGFIGNLRFSCYYEENGTRIIFLDCGRELDSVNRFMLSSIGMALFGFVIVFFAILFFSQRIIRPVAESHKKQKQFITNAGHEIKTPLTIISANVDILEMELGKNESLADIRQQTNRLKSLTTDLVMLTRMEEESREMMPKIEFPISEVVEEAANPFRTPAVQQGKEFICNIQPMLSLNGNGKAIGQLVSILLDNALKYSPAGGNISLDMTQQNRTIVLSVVNDTEKEIRRENLCHIFDRFYRTDDSRNSEAGGYGIGLSVAKAIVTSHDGKITATAQNEHSFKITAVFPIR